jgi:hypothetical protein
MSAKDKKDTKPRSFVSSIPINEVADILRQVNAYPRRQNEVPFPDLDFATERFIFAIELHNSAVETLHNSPTLTPRNQKDFFDKLQARLTRLIDFLEDAPGEYLERLHYHQRNSVPIKDRLAEKDDGLFADRTKAEPLHPQKFINTLKAYGEATKQLQTSPINPGRKDIHRDDLKQLIHFLFEVYEECSGREPGYAYGQDDNKELRYRSDFILLVELSKPLASLNNKTGITNNSIGEGLKSVKKERS